MSGEPGAVRLAGLAGGDRRGGPADPGVPDPQRSAAAVESASTVVRERRAAIRESTVVRERRHPIQIAWIELRKHGEACDVCGDLVAQLGRVPDDPRRADRELHPQFCADGREFHGAWVAAKTEWLLGKIQGRREALGFVGLSSQEAEVRARAIGLLTTEQFKALLALEDEPRQGQIRALVAAQQHRHVLREVQVVARSDLDDRLLYRWSCECGAEAERDYFSAEEARQGWSRHAGRPAGVQASTGADTHESAGPNARPWEQPGGGRRLHTCTQCGREHQGHDRRYCSPECRRLAAAAARLEQTE